MARKTEITHTLDTLGKLFVSLSLGLLVSSPAAGSRACQHQFCPSSLHQSFSFLHTAQSINTSVIAIPKKPSHPLVHMSPNGVTFLPFTSRHDGAQCKFHASRSPGKTLRVWFPPISFKVNFLLFQRSGRAFCLLNTVAFSQLTSLTIFDTVHQQFLQVSISFIQGASIFS